MRNRVISVLLLCLWGSYAAFSQNLSVVNNAGNHVPQHDFSFSIGEPIVGNARLGDVTLTQGFLQADAPVCEFSAQYIKGPSFLCHLPDTARFELDRLFIDSKAIWILPVGAKIVAGDSTSTVRISFDSSFSSSIIKVVEKISANCFGDTLLYTISRNKDLYALTNAKVTCKDSIFEIHLVANDTVPSGIIGFDFCLNYDTQFLAYKANSTKTEIVLNQSNESQVSIVENATNSGKIQISAYFNTNAPKNMEMKGAGKILTLRFNVINNPGTSDSLRFNVCQLTEGYYTSYRDVPVCEPLAVPIENNNSFIGKIYYSNSDTLIGNLLSSSKTQIFTHRGICSQNLDTLFADSLGTYSVDIENTFSLSIERDIQGNYFDTTTVPTVMPVINGADALMAAQISNDLIATPTNYQLVAADVNMDGRILASDATLITRRTVLQLFEYPQRWNYLQATPRLPFQKSKDWIFASKNYLDTLKGTNKNKIPSIYQCIPIIRNITSNFACADTTIGEYTGILLGDIAKSWLPNSNLRSSQSDYILVNLDKQITVKDSIWIPISVFSEKKEITSFDFDIKYLSKRIVGTKVIPNYEHFEAKTMVYNQNNFRQSRLMLSNYRLNNEFENDTVYYFLKVAGNEQLKIEDFGTSYGYRNGEPVPVIFSEDQKHKKDDTVIKIYPNPSDKYIVIDIPAKPYDQEINYTLYETLGKLLETNSFTIPANQNMKKIINLEYYASALYILTLKTTDSKTVYKIIKK